MRTAFNILIIDDEEMFHEYIVEFLNIDNAQFFNAYNGKEGLDLYLKHEHSLSLVILDIKMPIMNGVEFLRKLKAKRDVTCPVIVLSGWLTEGDRASCINFGAKDVLAKPISPEKLKSCVNYHLKEN